MFDLAIIGGGPLGVFAARHAALRGLRVILLRRRDQPAPDAEGLRNQAWLQSGLHFAHYGIEHARFMRDAGTLLKSRTGIDDPPHGIMCIRQDHVSAFCRNAADLEVPIRQLDSEELRSRLGRFTISPGSVPFDVPDGPFAEANILRLCREIATSRGAILQEVDNPITLEAPLKGSQVTVIANDQKITAASVLVSAGVGTISILKSIDIDPGFNVVRTPLMIVKQELFDYQLLSTPLLVDAAAGFSVTIPFSNPADRLVFAVKQRLSVSPSAPDIRTVSNAEQSLLLDTFKAVTGVKLDHHHVRFSGGCEIFKSGTKGIDEVMPIVGADDRYPNLRWALPGRATFAAQTAEIALQPILQFRSKLPLSQFIPVGRDWSGDIFMHHHHSYDSHDEGHSEATI